MKTAILAALALAAFAGCSREEEASRNPAPPAGTAAKSESDAVFSAYERARALLAEDRTEGLADAAGALAGAAEQAGPKAPEAARAPLKEIAASATRLKEEGSKDIARARRAFGEVSRHLIQFGSAEPSLATGRHVFLCGMAKDGYGKWIQATPGVSNPYMGKKMPG